MSAAKLPETESERIRSLHGLAILDTEPEEEFDALVNTAAILCEVTIAAITLVDRQRQWFKASVGLNGLTETPRELAFCSHAILEKDIFEVPDTRNDPRFSTNPLVLQTPHIRYYAGVPLRLSNGQPVGTLCVFDQRPRQLKLSQKQALRHLATAVSKALEARSASKEIEIHQKRLQTTAMHESQNLIDAVKSQFIVAITDSQGKFIEVNDAFCRLTGYSHSELFNQNHHILHTNVNSPELFKTLWSEITAGRSWRGEICDRNKAGELFWVDCSVSPLFGANHTIERYIAFSIDITERVNQNALIQSTSERMMLATNSGGIGVWDYDLQTEKLTWDGWMYRLYGLDDAVELGAYELWDADAVLLASSAQKKLDVNFSFWKNYVHPDDRVNAVTALQEAIDGTKEFDTEFRIVWNDGRVHYLHATAVVTRDSQGKALRMVGTNYDVTQLRELGVRLADHDELMRVTLMSIADAVITTDSQSKVTWLNVHAEKLTGWNLAQAQGKLILQVFNAIDSETKSPIPDPVETCLKNKESGDIILDHVLISRDGIEYGIEDSFAAIRNEQGDGLGVYWSSVMLRNFG